MGGLAALAALKPFVTHSRSVMLSAAPPESVSSQGVTVSRSCIRRGEG